MNRSNKILCLSIIGLICLSSIGAIAAETITPTEDDLKKIKTVGTRIMFDGNDIDYDGKIIGNITEVESIYDAENMIEDKEAIKEVYSDGLEYLANEGQYYVFEVDGKYYVMFIKESSLDIAADCKEVCTLNTQEDFSTIPGALDANGFDLELKTK